ncbi:MAG: biotin transporter BioY [Clostridia bacterium]|nr:biotin transporter BioY [Clostridia bacterium]
MKRRNLIVTLTLSALFCTLIIIGSFIKIPMPNMMPMTLQTFFVLLAGLLLNVKASTLATITYMALGLIGLPIFSGGGGIGYVLMPNFGFIIGFIVATVIISVITQKLQNRKLWQYIVVSLLGITVIYIIGIFYFAFITNVYNKGDYSAIWFIQTVFLPFLPKEIICIILASLSAYKIRPYTTKIPQ